MNISLDFDDTYTADPQLWDAFIENAQSRGHKVYCVTMRHELKNEEAIDVYNSLLQKLGKDAIIFTGRKAKKLFVTQLGIQIDIWIDDSPGALFADYK